MEPKRWQEIERLYHAALERDGAQRAAFLQDACGGDNALRHEVESLLAHHTKVKDFIETPAVQVHLPLLSRVLRSVRDPHDVPRPGRLVGRTLGVYRLSAFIGAGGMGEVYRGVDTRLNRTVAIKVLPQHVSNDRERQERFRREAKIISSLNHPHICALYDVGVDHDIHFLVMEYVDGETLQDRLQQGPLASRQALEYAIQICDALDRAHRRGVVHRDLKPANVMLTRSGVKLLDFGAATWAAPADEGPPDLSTVGSQQRLTAEGIIIGTLHYLSPEQLEGRQAGARSDIFAFGTVVYEMLAGKPAFGGTSPATIIGAILRDDPPPVGDVAPGVPPPFARAITRCLAKDPDDRWQTANDLVFQLRSIESAAATPTDAVSASRSLPRWIERSVWMAAVLSAMAVLLIRSQRDRARPVDAGADAAAVRFTLSAPEGTTLHSGYSVPFAVSANGHHIVYVADQADGTKRLWLRSLDSGAEQAIPGTEGASTPFWSPDSLWVGFFAGHSLKKVRVSTGLTQIVASSVRTYGGAAWSAGDVILFPAANDGLSRVSAQGGPVTSVTKGVGGHFWPQFLRDGERFIYAEASSANLNIGSLRNDAPRTLMKFPVRMSSLAYAPGFVFFVQDATLFARSFDEDRLEFSGDPIQIHDGIPVSGPGRASFSVSAAGVLASWSYPIGMPAVLRWFERDGRSSPAVGTPAQYVGFALSPDARQLVFSRKTRTGSADLWLRDLAQGTERQLTFDGAAFTPQWSPDGTRIVFTGPGQSPPPKLFVREVTGPGSVSQVGHSPTANFASGWSGDGASIVSVRIDPAARNDLWVHHLKNTADEPLPVNTRFNESEGRLSPDDRWITYTTDESGREEVWVASFPSARIRRRVSVAGGSSPQWGGGGRELFYVSENRELMASSFSDRQTGIELGPPQVLFPIRNLAEVDSLLFPASNVYAADAVGQRFLIAIRTPDPNAPPIDIVVNWRALLKR